MSFSLKPWIWTLKYISSFDSENTHSQKLLRATIDYKLNFHDHISTQCKKASTNISGMTRIFPFMLLNQRKLIMKDNLMSKFGYCQLVWMNHNRASNNRINSLHERALRLVCNDFKSSFDQLLEKDNSVTIHQRNLLTLKLKLKNENENWNWNWKWKHSNWNI